MPHPPIRRPLHTGWTLTTADLAPDAPRAVVAALDPGVPATVPGEAHLDLLRAGLIDDPFDGDNEAAQQWIGDTSWRFTTTFAWDDDDDGATRHDLVALGLDTVATVELNGSVVGRTQNMHRSWRWDVRDHLRAGDNTLTVTFAAPVPEAAARAERDGALPRVNHHEYNQLRKMACSFGWDWGIDVAGAGIWKPIGLDSWSGVRIASVRPLVDVAPAHVAPGTFDGVLAAHVEIERDGVGPDVDVPVVVEVTAPSGTRVEATGAVAAGATVAVVTAHVRDVERWWPVGHGDQPLYDVEVTAGEPDQARARWTGRVGFRTVELDTTPDAAGAPFLLKVNGETILVRGANWIPDHAFLTQVDRERYARRVGDALEANLNLLRVWGGGIYESDDLYDLADERGLLVWQDFPFACAAYSEAEPMRAEVEAEARENVTRLSPHPSLVLWNGNNENTWGSVDWGWAGPLAGRGWGDAYYSDLLPRVVGELDPTRPYSPASPFSFGDYRHPNDERYGTMHIWDVWNREDYAVYRNYKPRFLSEFGFQGPPAWSTLTRVVHDEPLEPFGHQMLVHQKANLGNAKLERGWQGHLPDPTTIERWHWTTQLNQAHAVRFGIEHVRSLTPHNTGVIVWQLNDNWPVVSWAAVDHDEHRKPLWHALRAACAPRLATFQPRVSEAAWAGAWEGVEPAADTTALVLVNDTALDVEETFTVTRETVDGAVLARVELAAAVPARGAVTLPVPDDVARFDDAAAELLVAVAAGSTFATAVLHAAEVVDQRLDPDALTVAAVAVDGGCELTLTAHSLVRDAFCRADVVDPAARVGDGLVTLRAGESVVWRVTSPSGGDAGAFAAAVTSANDLLGA
jgi:beta-mannosidase